MTSLGSAMKALTAMMRGKQAYDAERVKAYAVYAVYAVYATRDHRRARG